MNPKLGIALCLGAALANCDFFAVHTAPAKKASAQRTEAALKADELFWATLHGGKYEQIPTALNAITAAYLENPSDPITAAHAGWLHIWRIVESARLDSVPATITDDMTLARGYFQQAVQLNPKEARYLGFLAASTVAEGKIHHDEKLRRRGYYQLLHAIDAWPEFNLFTAGYTLSGLPADSPRYHQALEWQWQTLDVCNDEKIDRQQPSLAKYMTKATGQGKKRVCWNSWIAPHNFEGFLLNMGDMLVKSGNWQLAQKVYANARLSSDFDKWSYRDVLEQRIVDAPRNVALFNRNDPALDKTRQRMMGNSTFACMGCHQQ